MTDQLFSSLPFARQDKLAELRREIGMRRQVYGRQVAAGRMDQGKADRSTAIMEAIARDYEDGDLFADADELLRDCRRYLSEFGSIDPDTLAKAIDRWRNDYAIQRSREGAEQ